MSVVIGVTGQIGSGKSVVSKALSTLYDVPYYDSDGYAKELYLDAEVRVEIQAHLGFDPIDEQGTLDKHSLRQALEEEQSRRVLEQINHRAVHSHFEEWAITSGSEVVVLESAILFSSGFYRLCDLTVVVVADPEVRKERVLARDNERSEEDFERIEWLQAHEATRQGAEADITIVNNGTSSVIRAVEALWASINKLIDDKNNEAN